MVKVDLISGFLGCGKTTFIRKYADYLMRQGLRINVIENEFGGVNVDSIMLKDEDFGISEISGGCMCCTAKAALQDHLMNLAASDCDRIIIEPSGIYDVDEFFEVMLNDPVKNVCEIGSIIAIADADFAADRLSHEANYLMFSQLVSAGKLLISKTQLFPEETCEKALADINSMMVSHGSTRTFGEDICTKDWAELTDEDFAGFAACGYQILDHPREFMNHGQVFTGRALAHLCAGPEDLRERLTKLMSDPSYGRILRIKGLIADTERNWYEINCSMDGQMYIRPADARMGLFVVIGQDLNEEAIHSAFISRRKQ